MRFIWCRRHSLVWLPGRLVELLIGAPLLCADSALLRSNAEIGIENVRKWRRSRPEPSARPSRRADGRRPGFTYNVISLVPLNLRLSGMDFSLISRCTQSVHVTL